MDSSTLGKPMENKPVTTSITADMVRYMAQGSVVQFVDKRVFVASGSSYYVGDMKSFDAYGGIVLSNAVERVVFENKYSDRAIGTRVFRGPAIDLVGENNDNSPAFKDLMQRVSWEEIQSLVATRKPTADVEEM